MMKSRPFSRLIAFMDAMAGINSNAELSIEARQKALSELGPYVSKGKGKGERKRARHGKHMSMVRSSRRAHNVAKRKSKRRA